jgi:hypothetical protein
MLRKLLALFVVIISSSCPIYTQNFSIEAYKNFLKNNENMTSDGLYSMYPPGLFSEAIKYKAESTNYYDTINKKLSLTDCEKQLIHQHGFMVSERLSYISFWDAYKDIWQKDLPVFISTDAILHALHMSYDAILRDLETSLIIPKLDSVLTKYQNYLPVLLNRYSSDSLMIKSLKDYDIYFAIALNLLNGQGEPLIKENETAFNELLQFISNESATEYPLFSETCRWIDFSQFTVRGHYTQSPELSRYFKSMMWLGRTEFYLIAPQTTDCVPTSEDIRRQIIDVVLIYNATKYLDIYNQIEDIDNIIKSMVGESDNVQLANIGELLDETGFSDASEFCDINKCKIFQDTLSTKSYADQKILSQILFSGPFSFDQIRPASSFLLFGQRFIIDSYIFSNVVYDKVKSYRMLPSSLDVLFALGNNAAGDLLKPELDMYNYSLNLSGLRYLIDNYNSDFWHQSFYNFWLTSIRTLNTPSDSVRQKYPFFMQTAAWWQEKINTQLSSWAQLRHDNLLYAKQSYTGGISCSNPDAFLEPIPEFYSSIAELADSASKKLELLLSDDYYYGQKSKIKGYFNNLSNVMNNLKCIAGKELNNISLTNDELTYLRSIFSTYIEDVGCAKVTVPSGWYDSLFYFQKEDVEKQDYVVADVHTAPTDADGNMVGWVKHVGTGPINLAVITTKNNNGEMSAFVGPVMSYYEYTSTNFKRLTDEEWKDNINVLPANRPFFVSLYLADSNGQCREINPASLPVGVDDGGNLQNQITFSNYPNPFSNSTLINFTIPQRYVVCNVSVDVFDIEGKLINHLFSGYVPSGNYIARWNGIDDKGAKVNAGVYFYTIYLNGESYSGKMLMN